MIYTSVSCKEIIARLLRNTRLSDSSYIDDMFEWIPEGINQLKTKYQLNLEPKNLSVFGNIAKLPCGLVSIEAVVYNGQRLREGSADISVKRIPTGFSSGNGTATSTVLQSDSNKTIENRLDPRLTGSDLTAVTQFSGNDFYKIQLDYIHTSFEEGNITLHYWKRPIDSEGYPLVPDNENYKIALYWYLLSMMIDAGYDHKEGYSAEFCRGKFEFYGGRAIAEIKYPSIDKMEKNRQVLTRLVPPAHLYGDFFLNGEQVQEIKK